MSGVVVVAPRSGPLIGLSLVKAHLRVEHNDHDTLIADHVEAAAAWLDGPAGWLGLALGPQTLKFTRAGFGGDDGMDLPFGPVKSIEGLTYRGWGGTSVDVDPELFELEPGTNRVCLASGAAWPSCGPSPVTVTYVAGYDNAALPASIRAAILLQVKILYDQPDDKRLAALEQSRDALLSPVRKWRV